MKKLFIPTVLALSSLAMVAQTPQLQSALSSVSADVPLKQVKINEARCYRPQDSKQAKAPMAQFTIIGDIGDGTYHSGLLDDFAAYSASFALGTLGRPGYFRSYVWTTDESTSVTPTWYENTGNGRGEALEMVDGQAKYANDFLMTQFPILVGTANDGSSLEFDRGNSPYATTNGAIYSAQFNRRYPLSMYDPSLWTQENAYFATYQLESKVSKGYAPGFGIEKLAQVFSRAASPVVVYGGRIAIVKGLNDPNQESFKNDARLHVALCTCDLENYQLTNLQILATASVGEEDLVYDDGFNGILNFRFTAEDDWGSEVVSPVVVPGGTYFALVVSGFDSADLNVCIPFSVTGPANRTDGYLYHMEKDADNYVFPFSEDGATYPQVNSLVSLEADLPGALWLLPEMEAPVEGGTLTAQAESTTGEMVEVNYNVVATSMPIESDLGLNDNYEFETPEWLAVEEYVTATGEPWNADPSALSVEYAVFFSAQPLPQGETGRFGTVYLKTRTGLRFGFNVVQGEVDSEELPSVGLDSAEESVNNAYVSGDQLNLTYAEGYGVADVYNVAGVKVASYQLPEGGSYEASVSGLADGVYVVVFRGADAATVKFVK